MTDDFDLKASWERLKQLNNNDMIFTELEIVHGWSGPEMAIQVYFEDSLMLQRFLDRIERGRRKISNIEIVEKKKLKIEEI